ncbi:MAG: hypothetical protein K8S16_13670 [Bacteroidales bacterium]|nr:hypothetical protein [Bacteroidales bacterium]
MEKNYYLKMPGVQELGKEELKKVDGGWLWALGLAATYIIVEAALNPEASTEAFNEGREMFKEKFKD